MPRYRYTALTDAGRTRRGLVEAENESIARQALATRGETPTHLKPTKSTSGGARISRVELAAFLADLAALHDAGVPLRRALDVLATGASSERAAGLARLIAERLDAGSNLSGAASFGGSADLALAAELVRAGEVSGKLGETLRFAAELLRRQADVTKRIASALAYPLFLVALSIVALIALAAFAGPAIAPLLEDAPNQSQGLRMVLTIGQGLRDNGLALLAGLTASTMLIISAAGRSPLREIFADFRCRIPIIGVIVRDINCGSFARTLGALLSGGAPAATAIDLAAASAPNTTWRRRFQRAGQDLREGRTVASALEHIDHASPELPRLSRVGEASGALGDMLSRAGQIAIDRALRRLDQAAAAAGPILILTMGGFTGWLMSAFLTGLSQLGEGAL